MQHKDFRELLCVGAIALSIIVVGSCSQRKGWSDEQRHQAREMLREWREVAYLNALSAEEFDLFAMEVTDLLEHEWPDYVEFIEMPMVGDSVEMVVVAAIVTEIKASPERLERLFPYRELVDDKVLPKGMSHKQRAEFYKCFSQRVNLAYGSMQQFIYDALYSRLDDELIGIMMRRCAAPYWEVIDVTIVEMEN